MQYTHSASCIELFTVESNGLICMFFTRASKSEERCLSLSGLHPCGLWGGGQDTGELDDVQGACLTNAVVGQVGR